MDPFLPTQEGPVTVSLALLDPSTADQHPKYAAITHKFKPDSIDYTKPGSLVNANETWTLEFASQEEGAQKFTVEEVPGKDIECLLFYDASTNTYTLEPLDSTIRTRPVRNDKPKRPDSKSTPLTLPPDSGATSPVDADFEDIFSDDDAAVAAEIMDEDFDDAFNEGDGGDDDEFERSLEEEIEAVQLDDDGFVEEEGEGRHIVGEEDGEGRHIVMEEEGEGRHVVVEEQGEGRHVVEEEVTGEAEELNLDDMDELLDEAIPRDTMESVVDEEKPVSTQTESKKVQPMSLTAKYDGADDDSGSSSGSSSSGSDSDDSGSSSDSDG